MKFATAAAELRRAEIARLSDAYCAAPRNHAAMTPEAFRALTADMFDRFGHQIVTDLPRPIPYDQGTRKNSSPDCAAPTDIVPTGTRKLARLHDAVITANAARDFITARGFTDAALQYAESAPLDLIDGRRLVKALNQSSKHVLMPQTYRAMCQNAARSSSIGSTASRTRPDWCSNGHAVAPTIARALLLPPRPIGWKSGEEAA